jgi:hypothetical protein
MVSRRSGLQYIRRELIFRKFFLEQDGFNKYKIFLFGIIRVFLFSMPGVIKTLLYTFFLRNRFSSLQHKKGVEK